MLLWRDQQMDNNLVPKTKITIDIEDTVLNQTKGGGGTTNVNVQTLISFTVQECIGIVGQAL